MIIADTPEVVSGELLEAIRDAITDHPRSQQREIGPSGVGEPCDIALTLALAGIRRPENPDKRWLATIGTAVHAWLADVFARMPDRYLVETRVTVGEIAGVPVVGSADCFDYLSGTVIDWKIVGKSTLDRVRLNGPGAQYRAQIHLYGRGFAAARSPVQTVMVYFLPREGALSEGYAWAEPYNESVAVDALARATGLVELTAAMGSAEAAIALYEPCTNWFCSPCRAIRARQAGPTGPPTSTRALFAGSMKGKK